MPKPSVLVLYNQPLLPADHPDAAQEHTVVAIAEFVAATLLGAGLRTSLLGLGAEPTLLWRELKRRRVDAVFNLFEGNLDNTQTESYAAGLLDWAGVPYTGSPFATLALARAKHTTKYLLKGAGLPTADFQIMHALPVPACTLAFPVIVKPATQDASIGIDQASVCTTQRQVEKQARYLFNNYGGPVLIEEYIPGREFNISLLELPELQALMPMEIALPAEKAGSWSIFTYRGKWLAGTPEYEQTQSRFPTDLSAGAVRKLQRVALQAYRLLGCRDYARVDFRVKPNGKAYILEVNPNPDISVSADLTACLGPAGMTHPELIIRLAQQALSRGHAPKPTFGAQGHSA